MAEPISFPAPSDLEDLHQEFAGLSFDEFFEEIAEDKVEAFRLKLPKAKEYESGFQKVADAIVCVYYAEKASWLTDQKPKIKAEYPTSKIDWHATLMVLQSGGLHTPDGEMSVVVPIIRRGSRDNPPKPMAIFHAKHEPNQKPSKVYPCEWEFKLYVLKESVCIRVVKGEIFFILIRFSPRAPEDG